MADKHPLDVVAEQAEADAPVAAEEPSSDYWELHPSTDAAVVGDYPQAVSTEPRGSGGSRGLGADDLFTLAWTGVRVFISARLKDAIESSGLTGLEIRPNKRLFAGC